MIVLPQPQADAVSAQNFAELRRAQRCDIQDVLRTLDDHFVRANRGTCLEKWRAGDVNPPMTWRRSSVLKRRILVRYHADTPARPVGTRARITIGPDFRRSKSFVTCTKRALVGPLGTGRRADMPGARGARRSDNHASSGNRISAELRHSVLSSGLLAACSEKTFGDEIQLGRSLSGGFGFGALHGRKIPFEGGSQLVNFRAHERFEQ